VLIVLGLVWMVASFPIGVLVGRTFAHAHAHAVWTVVPPATGAAPSPSGPPRLR